MSTNTKKEEIECQQLQKKKTTECQQLQKEK